MKLLSAPFLHTELKSDLTNGTDDEAKWFREKQIITVLREHRTPEQRQPIWLASTASRSHAVQLEGKIRREGCTGRQTGCGR